MSLKRMATIFVTASIVNLFAVYTATAQSADSEHKVYPIHFPTNSSKLDAADRDTIRGVAASLQADPALGAIIIGKADKAGSAEYNLKLSQHRAEAVLEALVYANKVPESRVEVRWAGEHLPYLPTEEQKAEMLNRVVEIIVHKAE